MGATNPKDRDAAERWFARYGEPLPNDAEIRSLAAAFAEVRTEERTRCERAVASAAIDERLLARLLEYLRCLGCEGEHGTHYAECPAVTVSLNEARRVRAGRRPPTEGSQVSPAVAAAVAELVRHRTTSALRQAAAEVPPDMMGDYCEFLVLVAFELAKLGSTMTSDVLGLRLELMGGNGST